MSSPSTSRFCIGLAVVSTLLLGGCGSGGDLSQMTSAAALGEKIFHDTALSASGKVACASCHQANHAFASDAVVNPGGPALDQSGTRNAPTLTYLDQNPAFFFDGEGTPTGGFDRDGRANSLIEQARGPMLSPLEMANASPAEVVAKLRVAPYASEFRALFGASIFDQGDDAFERALFAVAAYQREDRDFHPYNSKYDAFLAGKTQLSTQEVRGLALFNNPQKGNCAACHPSGKGPKGELPLFTDFTFDNLGVPREASIPVNADPAHFDLGLCGPDRADLADRKDLCGAFKVPTLRNIARTAPYFHNGRFETLQQALGFYVRRDTNPEEWYPLNGDGTVNKFNDLPAEFKKNVNTTEAPYNRHLGDAPALSPDEIDDVIAFLNTLTDGFTP